MPVAGVKAGRSVFEANDVKPEGDAPGGEGVQVGDVVSGGKDAKVAGDASAGNRAKAEGSASDDDNAKAEGDAPAAGNAASERPSTDEKSAQVARRARRRRIITLSLAAVVLAIAVFSALFSWNRWYRFDDHGDMLGDWYVAGTSVPVVITEDKIEITDDVSYGYDVDEHEKVIRYTFGQMQGQGHYWFNADRTMLVITDGEGFTGVGTALDDLLRTLSSLVSADDGTHAPEGEGVIAFSRSATAAPPRTVGSASSASASSAPASAGDGEAGNADATDAGGSEDANADGAGAGDAGQGDGGAEAGGADGASAGNPEESSEPGASEDGRKHDSGKAAEGAQADPSNSEGEGRGDGQSGSARGRDVFADVSDRG